MNADSKARLWLGALITIGFFGIVTVTLFVPTPTALRDILLVLIGALVGSFKDVTSYYFGTTAGSSAKDSTIRELAVQAVPLQLPPPEPEPTPEPAPFRSPAMAAMTGRYPTPA